MMPSHGPDPRDYECMARSVNVCDGAVTGYTRRDLESEKGWEFRPIRKNGHVDVFVMCGMCVAYWRPLWAFREDA